MRRAALTPLLLWLVGVASCGAPGASRATGAIAEAVEASLARGTERFDHEDWTRLLAGGTRDGLVDYRYMREHRADLERYVERIAAARIDRLAAAHLEALLINAYNAYTLRSILEHPGVGSIREIDGVWKKRRHRVGGFDVTLDEIEHHILRPFFKDPRIHSVVNCASRSCAPLPPWGIDGDRIDSQLEERTVQFLHDRRNARVEDGKLILSKYFDWYRDDYVGEGWRGAAPTISAYVARYAMDEVAAFIDRHQGRPPITFAEYDWSLNAAAPPP